MDPFTWMAIAMALSAAGAATSFIGSQKAAGAAEDGAKMQQESAEAEARNSELEAAESVRRERDNKRRRLARLSADMGGAGVTMAGTMEDAFQETAGMMEMQILDISRKGNMGAADARYKGDLALWEGRNSAIQKRISGYGTLLSEAETFTDASKKASELWGTRRR